MVGVGRLQGSPTTALEPSYSNGGESGEAMSIADKFFWLYEFPARVEFFFFVASIALECERTRAEAKLHYACSDALVKWAETNGV